MADMSGIRGGDRGRRNRYPERSPRAGGCGRHDQCGAEPRPSRARVTEIGNSPIQATTHHPDHRATAQATNVQGGGHDRGPSPRHSARVHVHRRESRRRRKKTVVSVPIQALTVRDLLVRCRAARWSASPRRFAGAPVLGATTPATAPPPRGRRPGQTRKETEGVFVFRDGKAVVHPDYRSASPASNTSR